MNGEVDYEKVLQIQFHGVNYIVTVKADAEGLLIQLQDKFLGEIWQNYYEPQYIEQITSKTGSLKRYNIFTKMLITAITGSSDSVHVDVLTHHDLEMQASRKNGGAPRTTDPRLVNKRYLIMSYMAQFDKVHYPLPLDYIQNPDPERLKLTIRRLSQQLKCFQANPKTDSIIKQLSALKHQHQLLRSKLKTQIRNQSKQNLHSNSSLQQQNKQLRQKIANLEELREEESNRISKVVQDKNKKIKDLQNKLKSYEQNNKNFQVYEQKLNTLYKQTNQIAAELQHSRQNEKKSQFKITNLQKELQKMMIQLRNRQNSQPDQRYGIHVNSPRKSDNGSVKSISSINNRKSTNKIGGTKKNTSVYDSETQSSRMRRNGKASPYRQNSRPTNPSNSGKKKQQQRANAISKYSNISNLYNKDKNRSRSRSKSRSIKRQVSPPSQNFQSSAVMTQRVDYPSDDEDENKISSTMERLRNHRNKKIIEQKQKKVGKQKQKKNVLNPIQQKISSIASLMRNLRNSNQNVQAGN